MTRTLRRLVGLKPKARLGHDVDYANDSCPGSSFMAQISAAPILTDSVDSHYR